MNYSPSIFANRSGTETLVNCYTYGLSKRRIYLSGEIDIESATSVVSQIHALEELSSDDITIEIDSNGGSVSAGFAIVDAMKTSKCNVITIATGMCASMAAVILACGTKGRRYITPLAEVMIHQPLGGVQGQASEISKMCDHILYVKDTIVKLLSEETGNNKKKILTDIDRDYYMNAEQAVKYGIVDKILTREVRRDEI